MTQQHTREVSIRSLRHIKLDFQLFPHKDPALRLGIRALGRNVLELHRVARANRHASAVVCKLNQGIRIALDARRPCHDYTAQRRCPLRVLGCRRGVEVTETAGEGVEDGAEEGEGCCGSLARLYVYSYASEIRVLGEG